MPLLTYRYKAEPSDAQYAALRSARWHCKEYRNACLEERIGSYRSAKAMALRSGRERPDAADWIAARAPHAQAFLKWQEDKASTLAKIHDTKRRISLERFAVSQSENGEQGPVDGRELIWKPNTKNDLNRAISNKDQMRDIAQIRAADPKGIGSVPVSVLREHAQIVHEAFQSFYKRVAKGQTPGFPRFKGFDQVTTLECEFRNGIGIDNDASRLRKDGSTKSIRLTSMMWNGGLKVRLHRPLPSTPKRVSLSYDGRFWWVSFLVATPDLHIPHEMLGTVLGGDVGVNRLITFDDGSYYKNPRFQKAGAIAVAETSRALARCKPQSNARRKAKRALAAAHRRVRNRRNTWRHTIAKQVSRSAETLVFEDLRLANMIRSASGTTEDHGTGVAQKRGLNRVLSDAGLALLVVTIRHKAESAGGRVILVDPRNSSLECSKCGTLSRKVVYERHDCPACGLVLHRDHNAAIVIRDRGLKILGPGHRPRRGTRSSGLMEDAGRHRPSQPEKKEKHRRDDVANLAASGGSG